MIFTRLFNLSPSQKRLLALLLVPLAVHAQDTCSLCQDGSAPPNPNQMLPMAQDNGADWSCGGKDTEARNSTSCEWFHFYGHLCGCNNTPPEDACIHCNIDMPDPDRITNPGQDVVKQGGLFNCGIEYIRSQYTSKEGDPLCETDKAFTGVYCGCQAEPPKPVCDLCPKEDEFVNIELVDPMRSELNANVPEDLLRTTCYNANYYFDYFVRIGAYDNETCQENVAYITDKEGPNHCCSPKSSYYADTSALDNSSGHKKGLDATLIITPFLWLSFFLL